MSRVVKSKYLLNRQHEHNQKRIIYNLILCR